MKLLSIAIIFAASCFALSDQDGFLLVKFGRAVCGENVKVLVDGNIESSFAGKLGFQDATHSWVSVCGNVRAPITSGQFFQVRPLSSKSMGGNIERAGNIVSKFFKSAITPRQCAALQIAVWEAMEVGGDNPDFYSGDFQVRAEPGAMALAQQYYSSSGQGGDVYFLQAGGQGGDPGGGQTGGGSGNGGQGGNPGGQGGGSGGQSQFSTGS